MQWKKERNFWRTETVFSRSSIAKWTVVRNSTWTEWSFTRLWLHTRSYQSELQSINLHRNKNNFLYSNDVISIASDDSYLSDYVADQCPKPSALN